MKIVAGTAGGRKLITPRDDKIRPTSDKVRGAIFNALGARGAVDGAHVMDVFCGSGALGLEALSRGAARCFFVDKARDSLNLAKENAAVLGFKQQSDFLLSDAAKIPARSGDVPQAGLVFLDPPYHKNLILPAVVGLEEGGWLSPESFIVIESERDFQPSWPVFITPYDEKIYGETKVIFARHADG